MTGMVPPTSRMTPISSLGLSGDFNANRPSGSMKCVIRWAFQRAGE